MMVREALFGKTLNELKELTIRLKLPSFTAKQLSEWLYKKDAVSIDEMTNISLSARKSLHENFYIGITPPMQVSSSVDGTKKYLFATANEKAIEAAYIPDKERATLCVSTQVGCRMGCHFCMTGKQGFQGNLNANEIVNQIRSLPEFRELTNIVYMGMGEPFDNLDNVLQSLDILTSEWGYGWSPKRITVSTIGIIPAMKVFLEKSKCHLAVSMHSPFDEERKKLMPIQNAHPITEIIKELKKYDLGLQRRVSFEYIVFKGINDSAQHVREIIRLLKDIRCRVNLIRYHSIPGEVYEGVDSNRMIAIRDELNNHGITATVRLSRGQDIEAACGMLSTIKNK